MRDTGMRWGWRATLAMLAAATLGACVGGDDDATARGDVEAEGWTPIAGEVRGVPVAEVQAAIRARLERDDARPASVTEREWARVQELYGAYGASPLFLGADGLAMRARAVITAIADAPAEALDPTHYPVAELQRAVAGVDARDPTADQLAAADLQLTAAYVAYAEDMLTGQLDPREVSQAWHIDPQQTDVDSAVARALRDARFDQALAGMRPQNADYELLRGELARYRELVAKGGWRTVPAGPSLKPGEPAPAARLQALRARLATEGLLALGDEPAPQGASPATAGEAQRRRQAAGEGASAAGGAATGSVYDGDLAGAVAQFQARHGIVVDSILGAETVTSLNVPAEYRLAQIAANLERHRWLPRTLGARYVLVNVPAFRLEAYEGGESKLTMNVVVGAEFNDQSTPTFADSMSYVVFRPYWNVPENIAEEEIYPKAAADPGYFEARNYEEVTENGKTRVRQTPGGDNALGLVKFMFPNEFAIYLHDTPEKALFQQDVRAASHGCIRVEHPDRLAQWVLGWDAERVRQAMASGEDDTQVDLERKVPVYIAYFTAYARDDQLYFGNDVYDRDRTIVQAIAPAARPDAGMVRAVRALRELAAD